MIDEKFCWAQSDFRALLAFGVLGFAALMNFDGHRCLLFCLASENAEHNEETAHTLLFS